MKIVVNYLREVKELFEEGKIDFVDYFKLFSLNSDLSGLDWCIENRPVMFHGIIGKESAFGNIDCVENTDFNETKKVLEKSRAPYISGHIAVGERKQTEKETFEAIKRTINVYREKFGMEVAVENIPYRKKYENCLFVLNPEFITKIVEETNCYFLFDISHARKASDYLHIPFQEYVDRLPMHRVIEFHLAGMYEDENGVKNDYHGKMNEEDYEFLREAIKKYPTLKYITLEYGSCLPFGKKEEEVPYPIASFDKVNPRVKEEVYEQLIKIKEILKR